MFTSRVWLKVAQKKISARGASFCHIGVCTNPPDRAAMVRDAWTYRQLCGLVACQQSKAQCSVRDMLHLQRLGEAVATDAGSTGAKATSM